MPDTRGRPLPSEILAALKDPSITSWLTQYIIQKTSSESIGRYPGNGSAQDDQYVYPDAADASFAYNFDYVIPSNFQRLVSAKLSFKIRPYRTYSSLSLTTTGTNAAGSSGHSHSHNHTWSVDGASYAAANLNTDNGGHVGNSAGGAGGTAIPTTTNAAGESGHSHSHNHTVSGTTTLGITEDAAPVNPGLTVSVDGVDVTTKLGGPFNADQVEIDVTQVVATPIKIWHTLSLQPNQRVRITGILRLSYYIDSRLAQ